MKIKVTRPFYLNGEPLGIGAKAEVDERTGRELIHNGKAVKDVDAPAEVPAERVAARSTKRKEAE